MGDSNEGVGLGFGGCEGKRLRHGMIYDDEPISTTKTIIRWREKDLHTTWKGLRQTAQRPDVSTQKADAVSTIDLIGIKGEEHRFIDVRNEICFYSSFAIECCGCQSDPRGNIDDATRKSKKFLVARNSFSSSSPDCAEHWIALTCGPSTLDFVLGKVERRMKCSFLINELRCSFYCGKNNEMNELGFVNPKRNMTLTGGVFLHRVWLNGECKSPTSLYQNDQRKRCYKTLPVWFESETLHVSVVGVCWKYSADRIRSNSISLDSNHAGWWIVKQGWKRSLYSAWNLFDETHPHCDRKWEGDSLCLLAWWCLMPSAHTTAPSLYSVSTYVVVVV